MDLESRKKEFIKNGIRIHGPVYDYSQVDYKDSKTHVLIICLKCDNRFEISPNTHISQKQKCACYSTAKNKKKTEKEVIENAIKKHGSELYDYSEVVYKNNKEKITIKCNTCKNKFYQTPDAHINKGHRCPICYGGIAHTFEVFQARGLLYHKKLYSYPDKNYINNHTKIGIFCTSCGEIFQQTPSAHIDQLQGCPDCHGNHQKTTEEFIKDAIKIHGNKYDYSSVDYKGRSCNIIIICKKCNVKFSQLAGNHLQGKGCDTCGRERTNKYIEDNMTSNTEEFTDKANIVHKYRYNYDKVIYKTSNRKVIITCKTHGDFEQIPVSHLRGRGCFICAKVSYSQKAIKWLKEMEIEHNTEIQHAENGGEQKIDLKYWGLKSSIYQSYFLLDGFDGMNLVCFEFHGCLWHGCPCMGDPDDVNLVSKKTFKELYEKTMEKERLIKLLKFELITIWECEYDKQKM